MRTPSKGEERAERLGDELLRIRNLILFTRMKQRYFPQEYGSKLNLLSDRWSRIAAMMLERGSVDE